MDKSWPPVLFRFADAQNATQLSRVLGIPEQLFRQVIRSKDPSELYVRHEIPKKNPSRRGETRVVWECGSESLSRAHKAAARRIDAFARTRIPGYPHPAAHGYLRGGSTRRNATPHCGAKFLVRADIENFFPSISARSLARMFRGMGLQTIPARLLAKFFTIEGALALGLPGSPALSNMVVFNLDMALAGLAARHNAAYTRYADDLTFSGPASLPSREDLRRELKNHGFNLSDRKFKTSKRGQAHYVTGLSVSANDYPHAPRKMKSQLRQELYYCEKYGLAVHASHTGETVLGLANRLAGTVDYVSFMERRQADRIRQKWRNILGGDGLERSFESRWQQSGETPLAVDLIVDETDLKLGKDHFLALCFVRTNSRKPIARAIGELLTNYLTGPGAKGKLGVVGQRGLHYNEAHFDLRAGGFATISNLPWSASIAFSKTLPTESYQACWLRLFRDLLRQEFITLDGCTAAIYVEQNGKIKKPKISDLITEEYTYATRLTLRRPTDCPSLEIGKKNTHSELAIPDFALAAFRLYAMNVGDERILEFEWLRDKLRYIHDLDSDKYYSRRKPFVGLPNA